MPNHSSAPIGVFDSGVGGLTVLRELIEALPNESFIYYGDTARLPYGNKSPETVLRFSIENTVFLLEKDIKMLVVACNTATAHALGRLQQIFSIPIIGVIEPGADHAVKISNSGRIAILATKGTIESNSYQNAIRHRNESAEVFSIPCPLFVPIVEEHFSDHPATKLIVQEYLKPIKSKKVDTILLGCTHYPLLIHQIREEVGPNVKIIDSAWACAQRTKELLQSSHLNAANGAPSYQFFVSDNPDKFQVIGEKFLNMPCPCKVSVK